MCRESKTSRGLSQIGHHDAAPCQFYNTILMLTPDSKDGSYSAVSGRAELASARKVHLGEKRGAYGCAAAAGPRRASSPFYAETEAERPTKHRNFDFLLVVVNVIGLARAQSRQPPLELRVIWLPCLSRSSSVVSQPARQPVPLPPPSLSLEFC